MTIDHWVIYPENNPELSVTTSHRIRMGWLTFWMGLKTYFPDPRKAQRICVEEYYKDQ